MEILTSHFILPVVEFPNFVKSIAGAISRSQHQIFDYHRDKKNKEFIIKELKPWSPHIVYVNGQSILTPKLGEPTAEIRYIEPEFKRWMEEGVKREAK